MKYTTTLLAACLLLAGCGNRIIYYGRTYAPTENVEIFFREGDLREEFEVMGKATYEVSAKKSSDRVQRDLEAKVRRKGADAMIFDALDLTTTGSSTGGAAAGAGRRGGFLGVFGSKTKFSRGQQIKVTLVKYKRNIP